MMFGPKVKYSITYKAGESELKIYQRKYIHNYMVTLSSENHEGAFGCNLNKLNFYAIGKFQTIIIYDQSDFSQRQTYKIPCVDQNLEILYMVSSKDDERIGITFGTRLILNRFYIFAIIILKKNQYNKFEMERYFTFDFHGDVCI